MCSSQFHLLFIDMKQGSKKKKLGLWNTRGYLKKNDFATFGPGTNTS